MQTKHLAAEIKAAKDSGSFEAVLSMPTVDRDGEVIDAGAFLPLPKKITIDVDHGLSAEKTIGSGVPFYDGDVLKVKGTFASTPLAQQIRTLVIEDHLGHMSVAYRAAKYETDEKDGLPHLRKGELINAAIVGIPANREAEILVAKALTEKVSARNAAKDLERLQSTHDHMVELGASCGEKHFVAVDGGPGRITADAIKAYAAGASTTAVMFAEKNGQTIVFDMNGKEIARSVDTKSADTDPEVKAAAPAAAPSPAPTLTAVSAALAKARLLLLDE